MGVASYAHLQGLELLFQANITDELYVLTIMTTLNLIISFDQGCDKFEGMNIKVIELNLLWSK